ncbi:MAG TPA: DNA polymerase III subunit delta [Rhodocyclaceae bacterium]|nr:DNA polymerase III subunit delta [Rhodocyclaceae bacterium]
MPALRAAALAGQLARELAPLYVVHGAAALLIVEAGDAIRTAARAAGFTEREVLVAGAHFDWSRLNEACANLSLFGGDKLVELRIPTGKPGRDGAARLSAFAAALPRGVVVLIELPEIDWATQKSAWFQALAAKGMVVECSNPAPSALPDWIAERAARNKQVLSKEALQFIAERIEGNLLAAHQEVEKLALIYPAGALGLAEVRAAVADLARYDADDLRAAWLARDAGRCLRLLDALRAGGEALPYLLWALTQELTLLAQAREAMDHGQSADEVLARNKVFGSRQNVYRSALRHYNNTLLYRALAQAAQIDRIIKGVADGDAWLALQQLSLALCTAGETR